MSQPFGHLDERGAARMVDVTGKEPTRREATATALVRCSPEVVTALRDDAVPKGDVLAVARIAGVAAAKRTPDLLPLAHVIGVHGVEIVPVVTDEGVAIRATVRAVDRTGVEMEALTAASVAALAVVDMVKGLDRTTSIADVRLLAKSGGRSGEWVRDDVPATPAPDGTAAPGEAFDAVVLAGGEGRRLGGVSKAELRLGERTYLDRVLDAVVGARRRVVVGPAELARPDVPTTLEDPPLGGPVAGIAAGLEHLGPAGAPWVAVLACDVPRAAGLLPRLTEALAADPAADGAVAVDGQGHRQALVGVYRRAALAAAVAALAADGGTHGRSVRSLVGGLRLAEVGDPDRLSADADTWEDVAALAAADGTKEQA
ncbi:hypothetical protein AFE02nite_05190 [Actinotalea fermentans]|uniref:Uncharacterized protein n=1 Tax=Actinotalea fermentans TaxID=43671 RepID=A0A511YUB4_9CELL|nr:hypothetical protein AFE02nite_05190 [Actinotalea fermentans]